MKQNHFLAWQFYSLTLFLTSTKLLLDTWQGLCCVYYAIQGRQRTVSDNIQAYNF